VYFVEVSSARGLSHEFLKTLIQCAVENQIWAGDFVLSLIPEGRPFSRCSRGIKFDMKFVAARQLVIVHFEVQRTFLV
jgi:hypothetical protein